jgi:hypothetical protein
VQIVFAACAIMSCMLDLNGAFYYASLTHMARAAASHFDALFAATHTLTLGTSMLKQ